MDNKEKPEYKEIAWGEFKKMDTKEKIMEVAASFLPPPGKPEEKILNEILEKTNHSKPVKLFTLSNIFKAAAAVLILLATFYSVNNYIIHKNARTQFAEQKEIRLPDGSEVVLNAGSGIEWNSLNFENKRSLSLNGEAFFDVKKGDDFIINTKNGTIKILGTQLNIFSRNNKFKVSCISGKVMVTSNNQELILTPGEWAELKNSVLNKHKTQSIEKTISWKDGYLHFEDTQLVYIFEELERQFDVNIIFKGDSKRIATVDFSNNNLAAALDVICIPMELNYEINKRDIIIQQKE